MSRPVATVNLINLQVIAEEAIARDMANGSYQAKIAADNRHYHWHGTEQTFPTGMNDEPEVYAAALRAALPLVNTLRLPFNLASFDAEGRLHPLYERFLKAAAEQGFQILFVQNEGLAQRMAHSGTWTPNQIATALEQQVVPRMEAAWTKLRDWLDANPTVDAAVWGLELANEPATWRRAAEVAPWGTKQTEADRFADLYAKHMLRLAEAAEAGAGQKVLVGGWGYSGTFAELARSPGGGPSPLDQLRAGLGDALVWSAHLYPGWHGTDRLDSAEAIIARLEQIYAPVAGDDVVLTEFNLQGSIVNDITQTGHVVHRFGRLQDWFAEQGYGVGWFPGAEAGASSLVTIDQGGALRFLHQHSYAKAMNAFTLPLSDPAAASNDWVVAELIRGQLRNQENDPDYDPVARFDPVDGFGLAVGLAGNDTLIGRNKANNLLYGGHGNDLLVGAAEEDFLFGQYGNNTLVGGNGRDFLYGGQGDDILIAGRGDDVLEGGRGADWFVATHGNDVIVDFSVADGDVISLGRGYTSFSQVMARAQTVTIDGPERNDLRITHADGTTTTILNAAGVLSAKDFRLDLPSVLDAAFLQGPGLQAAANAAFSLTMGAGFRPGSGLAIHGSDGDDILTGLGQSRVFGGAGDDRLIAGPANDTMFGGPGADTFVIGAGSHGHVLTGGAGADRFVFQSAQGGSSARITDFEPAQDRLILDNLRLMLNDLPDHVTAAATASGTRLTFATEGVIDLDGVWL